MLYEIINPSDKYTLEAESHEIACIACVFLGRGQYSLEPQDGSDLGCPFFMFGNDPDQWWKETFGRTLSEALDGCDKAELAKCLESVLLGSYEDREVYDAAIAAIDDAEKAEAFRRKWHDKRSSMNDIGGNARRLAVHFSKIATAEKAAEAPTPC